MPLKVEFDLKVRRPWLLHRYGGTLLRVTLDEDGVSIVDLSRRDGVPIIILERIHEIGGNVYKLEQSIRWGTYIHGVGYAGRREALSEEETQLTQDEFKEFINRIVVPVHPDLSKQLHIVKGAQLNIGSYTNDVFSGYKSFYTILQGKVKRIIRVEAVDYKLDVPRTDEEIEEIVAAEAPRLNLY